ncbi:MAG: FecR domain-containing protein [Leptospiraceae bacterium]|nr:FecR domain-containing protein [Leptospiraceae bacterium]
MNFLRNKTQLATIVLLFLIFIFSFLLYRDLTQKRRGGNEKVIGYILEKENYIYRKYSSDVIWGKVRKKDIIKNKDTIRSLEGSNAEIHLYDGTVLRLEENSMIYLDFSENNINIDFRAGGLKIKRFGEKASTTKLKVNTKNNVTGVAKDTEVSLFMKGREELNLRVQKGKANFETNGKVKEVLEEESILAKGNRVEKTLTSIRLSEPAEGIYYIPKPQKIQFSWTKKGIKGKVIFEISKDYYFKRPVKRAELEKDDTSLVLPGGVYYWRVRGSDEKRKMQYSEIRKLSLQGLQTLAFFSPREGENFSYVEELPRISLSWEKVSYPSSYKLEIFSDPNLSKQVYSEDLISTRFRLKPLSEGTYYARLTTKPGAREIKPQVSDIRTFHIIKSGELTAPKVMKGTRSYTFSKASLNSGKTLLNWSSDVSYKEFEVEISKESDFKQKLLHRKVEGNFVKIPPELPEGQYYWRVRGIQNSGKTSDYSNARLQINSKEKIRIIKPDKNASFVSGSYKAILFIWTKASITGEYILEISKDKFSTIYKSERTINNQLSLSDLPEGEYSYRVRFIRNKEELAETSVRKLLILGKNVAPLLKYPLKDQIVNMTAKDFLEFRWEGKASVKEYRFRLFEAGKGKAIVDTFIKKNKYIIRNLRLLNETSYHWEVQSLFGKDRGESLFSKGYFSITLDNPDSVPQIITPDEQIIK